MRTKSLTLALALALAFFVGRELSRDPAPLLPQARAQYDAVAAEPPRWEYTCFQSRHSVDARANELGAEGWEMVTAAGAGGGGGPMLNQEYFFCFKRPLA